MFADISSIALSAPAADSEFSLIPAPEDSIYSEPIKRVLIKAFSFSPKRASPIDFSDSNPKNSSLFLYII